MKNFMFKSLNKAISTPIAIIIVIVVGVLAIGGVLAYQYYWQQPKEEIPKETPKDETAGWNVYRNEEYGFEVKYPPSWEIDDNGELIQIHNSNEGFNLLYKAFYDSSLGRNWTIEELIKNAIRGDKVEREQIILDGISATKVIYFYGLHKIIMVVAQKPGDEKIYYIDMEPSETPESESIFKQMLSTFRFIE